MKKSNLNTGGIIKHSIREVLEIIGDMPQSDHLHVFFNDEVISENPFPYPFRSDDYSILLLLSGKIKMQLNLIPFSLEANELVIIAPNMSSHILEIEEEGKIIAISFTVDFVLRASPVRGDTNAFDFFASKFVPKMTLSKDEVETFITLSKLLQKRNIENDPDLFGDEMLKHAFNLLAYQIAALYKKKHSGLKTIMSRKEELTLKFLKALDNNFKNERSVQFYADALFVTTGHLTKVLKEVSGKTAGTLIDDAVIMEARILLANPSYTVSQIADELQFSDQSFFGKFFKKSTGFSPSEYRKSSN